MSHTQKEKAYDVINLERLSYLNSINDKLLYSTQPLDLPVQSLLRIEYALTGAIPSYKTLARIWEDPSFLCSYQKELKQILKKNIENLGPLNEPSQRDHKSNFELYRSMFNDLDRSELLPSEQLISTRYGFGLIETIPAIMWGNKQIININSHTIFSTPTFSK